MSNVSHISCTACKGSVGFTNVDRIISCTWCGARLLVENDEFVPEYHVRSSISEVDARRTLQKFLSGESMPGGLLKNARFKSARLCFVPYHEVKSRRLGTIAMTVHKTRYSPRPSLADSSTHSGITYEEKRTVTTSKETEVVVGDVHRIEPAVEIEDFGLNDAGIFSGLKEDRLHLLPFDRTKDGKTGRTYPPTVNHKKIMENLNIKGFTSDVADDTQYVETRIRRIFYPLWRLRYRFAGRLYSAVVDGLTGELIFARAPQGDRQRVLWLVAGVSITGFTFGKILSGLSFAERVSELLATGDDRTGMVSFSLFLVFLLVAAMGLSWIVVWNQFRYPGDLIKAGGTLQVEKYNSLFSGRTRVPVFNLKKYLLGLLGAGYRR